MPKLPKKSTMKDVLARALGYASKLHLNRKLSANDYLAFDKALGKILKAIDK